MLCCSEEIVSETHFIHSLIELRDFISQKILPLCSSETPSGVLCPSLESSAQEIQGPVGAGPEEEHRNNQLDGAPLL